MGVGKRARSVEAAGDEEGRVHGGVGEQPQRRDRGLRVVVVVADEIHESGQLATGVVSGVQVGTDDFDLRLGKN